MAHESNLERNKMRIKKIKSSFIYSIIKKVSPPTPTLNIGAKKNYKKLRHLLEKIKNPKILIIGGGLDEHGQHISKLGERLLRHSVNLEIEIGEIVDVVGDGHNLSFSDESFDAVIIQAVLEHVKYPDTVVKEVSRVLKQGGYVYAEIPFMQGFHASPNDFSRFTHEGIDNLFSYYKKMNSGVVCGPSSGACGVLLEYLSILLSFNNFYGYNLSRLVFGWLLFPIKYIDYIILNFKYSENISSGFFYLGLKNKSNGVKR